jgi:glutathione synthase/RimK-type ligase-like ATP-grasp enzyme|tara:strand:+ start:5742 stop:6998 length:1257 start_codon:yes stop_codon:yes gene_type:complete
MSADDIPLYFDMDDLTDKQKADQFEQNQLMAMLQVSLLSISKPEDYVGMFDAFTEPPWQNFLVRHHELMSQVGVSMVPLEHTLYAPMDTFYETLAADLPPVELVTFLMISRSNQVIHNDQAAIDRMLKLNSKFHFADNAPDFGIPVPDTIIATQPLTDNAQVESFFADHDNQIILKMTGQPGARNVKTVDSIGEAEEFLKDYRDDEPVLVQRRLPLDQYTEWTIDLLVTDTSIEVDNVRRILVADGLWIGNHIPADIPLTTEQKATLISVGEYVRSHGIGTSIGENIGIDYFIGPDEEIVVTEINPRWTAGLFPSEALKRTNRDARDAVAYFELVRHDQYRDFLEFISERLPGQSSGDYSSGDYSIFPLGFSPFRLEIESEPHVYCWLIVMGDFPAYRNDATNLLGTGSLPNGRLIPL